MPRRRDFLASATFAALGVLAGCPAPETGDGDGTSSPTTSPDSASATARQGPSVETLTDRSRTFLERLAAGEFEAAHEQVDASVRDELTQSAISQAWRRVEATKGQFVRVGGAEHSTRQGYDVVVLAGEFARGRQRFQFVFEAGALVGFLVLPAESDQWEPPAYADESQFTEVERSIGATPECSLGATLTLPDGEDAVPGVVLVHGNGPNDRDESVGPNKPFRDLAWGLATRGIAVLRYDKRTAACDVDLASASIDDVVTDDAVAALEVLRSEERVSDDAVFVAGHSIGGTLAPRIAARDGRVAGGILLAPLGRAVPRAMVEQNEYILSLDGGLSEDDERQLEQVRSIAEQIRSLDIADDEVVYLGGREYWRTMTEYERFEAARELDVPLFLGFGGRDWQVTVEDDLELWRDALADEPNVTIRTYEDANHLLIPGSGQPTRTEYFEPGNVAEPVVADLADWIGERS